MFNDNVVNNYTRLGAKRRQNALERLSGTMRESHTLTNTSSTLCGLNYSAPEGRRPGVLRKDEWEGIQDIQGSY